MNIKRILTTAVLAALPVVASAATLVIPASGTGPGANDSRWQTELTLHNASGRAIAVKIGFHDGDGRDGETTVTVAPRATVTLDDVVHTQFNREAATGALVLEVADADLRRLAVTSRTFNDAGEGRQFGQDVPAINVLDAVDAGEMGVLSAPSSAAATRFNFGLFAVTDTTVRWQLIRANGTVAATKDAAYEAGAQLQYNGGIESFLGTTAADDDTVHAIVTAGSGIFYGSAINNVSGDPSYVPGITARDDIRIAFAGIDLDENGSIDLRDADQDGVVDTRMDIFTSLFPNFFRLVAEGESGEPVTFAVVSSPADAVFIDENGTLQVAPTANLRGTNGELKIRATAGGNTAVLTIPVAFK